VALITRSVFVVGSFGSTFVATVVDVRFDLFQVLEAIVSRLGNGINNQMDKQCSLVGKAFRGVDKSE
jgi:hypothetical protein